MSEPIRPVRKAMNRRTSGEPDFEHGMRRAADVYAAPTDIAADASTDAPAEPAAIRRPSGLPLLLLVALALVTAAGVVQVRARARVLGLGAEIAEMTGEHSRLLDERRRLEAERAYLRHPDYIQSVAAGRLHMVPAAPEHTQTIRLRGATLADGTGPRGQEATP
jgi:cell division protein FtsL